MAETCDLSDLMVEEELSRDVESLKAILASDAGSNADDHTRGDQNYNLIGLETHKCSTRDTFFFPHVFKKIIFPFTPLGI